MLEQVHDITQTWIPNMGPVENLQPCIFARASTQSLDTQLSLSTVNKHLGTERNKEATV